MNSPADAAVQQDQPITGPKAVDRAGRELRGMVPQKHGGALRPGGPGRPKGSLAPWSKRALRQVQTVFINLGGVEFMTEWARESPGDFFRVWSRLLPSQYTIDARHQHQVEPVNLTDADLLRVIALATRPEVLAWAADQTSTAAALDGEVVQVDTTPRQGAEQGQQQGWTLDPEPEPDREQD